MKVPTMFVGRRSVVVAASAFLALLSACGGKAEHAAPAISTRPEVYPLVLQNGQTAGWALASHDRYNLTVQYVMNPGVVIASADLCLAPNGWTPADACPWHEGTIAPVREASITIALPEVEQMTGGDLCGAPLWIESIIRVADETTDANKAEAWLGAFKSRVAFTFTCDPAPRYEGCVRASDAWLSSAAWPVTTLEIGGAFYKQSDLASLLSDSGRTDVSAMLARSLVTAELNRAAGAQAPAAIAEVIARGDSWIFTNVDADGRLPFGIVSTPGAPANPPAWEAASSASSLLDRYNAGDFGAAPCH
jgi:hypothetical protein